MVFTHAYGAYNVNASLNTWFQANITAAGLPAWMPSARVVFDYGQETPIISGYSGHAFSVAHLGADVAEQYQGRNSLGGSAGQRMAGIMEVNCWVSKQAAGNAYTQRLRHLGDMVTTLVTQTKAVRLTNYYTSTAAPSALPVLVRLENWEEVAVGEDPNPDIRRKRFLIDYSWLDRR